MTRLHPFPGDHFPEAMSPEHEELYVWGMVWPDTHLTADPAIRRQILGRFYASLLVAADDRNRPSDPPIVHVPSPN